MSAIGNNPGMNPNINPQTTQQTPSGTATTGTDRSGDSGAVQDPAGDGAVDGYDGASASRTNQAYGARNQGTSGTVRENDGAFGEKVKEFFEENGQTMLKTLVEQLQEIDKTMRQYRK